MKQSRQGGYILPIVLVLSSLASTILAFDVHRMQNSAQLHVLQLQKKALTLLMETESLIFTTQLELAHNQSANGCSDCTLVIQEALRRVQVFDRPVELSVSYVPCALMKTQCSTSEPGAQVLGVLAMTAQSLGPKGGAVKEVRYQRFAYISAEDGLSTVTNPGGVFRRSQLLESL